MDEKPALSQTAQLALAECLYKLRLEKLELERQLAEVELKMAQQEAQNGVCVVTMRAHEKNHAD